MKLSAHNSCSSPKVIYRICCLIETLLHLLYLRSKSLEFRFNCWKDIPYFLTAFFQCEGFESQLETVDESTECCWTACFSNRLMTYSTLQLFFILYPFYNFVNVFVFLTSVCIYKRIQSQKMSNSSLKINMVSVSFFSINFLKQ